MPITFVLAPDSFKESMTAIEVCQAMQRGISQVFHDAQFVSIPMADGGEGTLDAILAAGTGQKQALEVTGPLPEQNIQTYFILLDHAQTAVIEMAKANGIHLLPVLERNPMLTSSYGTGEMIRAALDLGVKKIIVAVGGSVTNDAGLGMAQALGARFLDAQGNAVGQGANQLALIEQIDLSQLDPRLNQTEIVIASDVNNPLTGPNGASYIFAPQKGADVAMVQQLDQYLTHFAQIIQQQLHMNMHEVAGAGAAGGLAYGLLVFAGASIRSGVEMVIELSQLSNAIATADYVFTGEGAMDAQTLLGKTPYGVARLAQQQHKPVIACVGHVGEGIESLYTHGFTAIFSIIDQSYSVEMACQKGAENMQRTCENIARLLKLTRG